MSIEKTIWQTYETSYEDLQQFAKDGINTWLYHNPEWSHGYMSGLR
jgi:mannosyltransferase OCH1-like enzyme